MNKLHAPESIVPRAAAHPIIATMYGTVTSERDRPRSLSMGGRKRLNPLMPMDVMARTAGGSSPSGTDIPAEESSKSTSCAPGITLARRLPPSSVPRPHALARAAIPVPVRKGRMVLHHGLMPHRSLKNASPWPQPTVRSSTTRSSAASRLRRVKSTVLSVWWIAHAFSIRFRIETKPLYVITK